MTFKRVLLLAATGIAAVAMLLPVAQSVNPFHSHLIIHVPAVYQADGNPFPPLPPKSASVLVADGNPFPPLPPGTTTGPLMAAA